MKDLPEKRFVLAAILHPQEELAYRNTRNDYGVRAGQVSVVDIHKRSLDNSGPSSKLSGKCTTRNKQQQVHPGQCDQIGLLLKSLGDILFSYKINPNIGQLLYYFRNLSLYVKMLWFLFGQLW